MGLRNTVQKTYVAKHKILDRPVKVDEPHYQETCDKFINYFSSIPGIHSILRFGSVSAPGLSDLDLLVVFEPTYQHRFATQYGLEPFQGITRYILLHPQISAPLEVVENVHRIFPISSISRVWGKKVKFPTHSAKESQSICLNHLLDMMIQAHPRIYWKLILSDELPLRYAINQLNLFNTYNSLFKQVISGAKVEWQKLADDIINYRSSYFQNSERENLRELESLLCRALCETYDMVYTLDHRLADTHFSVEERGISFQYQCPGLETVFSRTNDPKESIERTLKIWHEKRQIYALLPRAWFSLLTFYGSKEGPVSRHIRSYLQPVSTHSHWVNEDIFEEKIDLLNFNLDFFKRRKIPGVIFPSFGCCLDVGRSFFEKVYLDVRTKASRLLAACRS